MRLMFAFAIVCLIMVQPVRSAEFYCVSDPHFGKVIENPKYDPSSMAFTEFSDAFQWQGGQEKCVRALMLGRIVPGDADKLEWLILHGGNPFNYILLSPGGNMVEAMTMGRLLRTAQASASASSRLFDISWTGHKRQCGEKNQPVCCASACALMYFGAAQWNKLDRLGLHRPTREDLGALDYQTSRKVYEHAVELLRKYLGEMEVEKRYFEIMMRAAPDEMAIIQIGQTNSYDLFQYIYPPTMNDWLLSKCSGKYGSDKNECMDSTFRTERPRAYSIAESAKHLNWYPHLTASQLSALVQGGRIGDIRMSAIRNELDIRQLEDKRVSIEAMSRDELKAYIRKTWTRSTDSKVSAFAFDRLERITGDRIVGDPLTDCVEGKKADAVISGCSIFLQYESLNNPEDHTEALSRRAEAYITLGKFEEAMDDLGTIIKRFKPTGEDAVRLHARYAVLAFELKLYDIAVDSFSKAIRSPYSMSPSSSAPQGNLLLSRALAYDKLGEHSKGSADRAAARTYCERLQLRCEPLGLERMFHSVNR